LLGLADKNVTEGFCSAPIVLPGGKCGVLLNMKVDEPKCFLENRDGAESDDTLEMTLIPIVGDGGLVPLKSDGLLGEVMLVGRARSSNQVRERCGSIGEVDKSLMSVGSFEEFCGAGSCVH
jgi:hypothetical protein